MRVVLMVIINSLYLQGRFPIRVIIPDGEELVVRPSTNDECARISFETTTASQRGIKFELAVSTYQSSKSARMIGVKNLKIVPLTRSFPAWTFFFLFRISTRRNLGLMNR